MNNSNHNVIENVIIINDDNTRQSGTGFDCFLSNVSPDSNIIQNNFVKKAGLSFYIINTSLTVRASGNIIRGNKIGSETDSLIANGFYLSRCENTLIENNIIQNLKTQLLDAHREQVGIMAGATNNTIIRNNVVRNFKASMGFTGTGILVHTTTSIGENNLVYNNMIYDIQSSSTENDSRVAGIQLENQNNPKIYYNSVYLTGKGENKLGSAALYIHPSVTNADVKNNIFINTRDESPYCASAIYDYGSTNLISDFNDLYYDNTNANNCLVRIGSTNYHTLADWQATGKDFHSISVMPCFSGTDLHIDVTEATCLESRGTPIPGIDTDFDGEPRHQYLPDIGADEFDGLRPAGALTFGAYSVGTHGFFTSIESVFNRLSSDGVDAAVTLELIDELYVAPTTQFGFRLNGPIPGAGPNSRVTIKPAENKNVTIQGNREALLYLVNTSYVTFDGVEITGPTTLIIHALQNSSFGYNDGIVFVNNSDHNVIQKITFIIEDYNRASGNGFYYTQTGSAVPDSNLIQNNFVKQAGLPFFVMSSGPSVRGKGNIIRGNMIGSETDSLIAHGIEVTMCENTIIEDNIIQNLRFVPPGTLGAQIGIASGSSYGDIIRNNVIYNLKAHSGWVCSGITLGRQIGLGNGEGNQVYNNMIYNIQSTATQSNSKITGISVQYQNNPKIYYNSVYLTGTGNGANLQGSAALHIANNVSDADIKNNILVNTRDESPYCASAIYDYGSTNFTIVYLEQITIHLLSGRQQVKILTA
jgi:hypothetical protein